MKWTKEQQRIIDIRNTNVLVSAAAGSGKTAVLVERIIKLITEENIDVDKFLVVTFTNAAAEGMKQKIQKQLLALGETGNTKFVRKQLNLLNKAQITTIHSFCLDVVKKNFHKLGINPVFRIGDNSEIAMIFQESIDEVLEESYMENSEDFIDLVESFTNNKNDDELNKIINKIYKFIMSFPNPMEWLSDSVENINMTIDDFRQSIYYRELLEYIEINLEGAVDLINLGISIANKPDGPQVFTNTLKQDLALIEGLKLDLENNFDLFMGNLNSFKAPTLKGYHAKNNPKPDYVDDNKIEFIKSKIRDEYKKILGAIQDNLPYDKLNRYIEEINHMYISINKLKDLVINIHERFKVKKLEKSILTFNDLEHYALEILRDTNNKIYSPSKVAINYKEKFNYVFIDEYQDSNLIQETIISQIKRENNLFMVGDIKQSIYKFRLADPSIFNDKYDSYEIDSVDLCPTIQNRIIELNKNFRSRREVLDATNTLFNRIMTKTLGEIDYVEKVYLNCGSEFPKENPVELVVIDKKQTEEENNELEEMKEAQLEALYTVSKIKEILNTEIYNREKSSFEKVKYNDIVILMRAVSAWAPIFEEIFYQEGIPFYFDGGVGYYETNEIKLMINLLRIIDNMNQDIPMLSVLRSQIGGFTMEELVEIRAEYPRGTFVEALFKYLKEDRNPNILNKLNDFVNKIQDWNRRSKYTDLHELIWEVLMESKYYHFVGALPNGKLKQGNLRMLSDIAYDFEQTSMKGLFKFLRYVEKLEDNPNDDTSTAKILGENDDVVRLMSIHNSKGLEFPIVFVCGLNKRFNLADTKDKILLHKTLGVGTKYINHIKRKENQTIVRELISNKIKFENLSEEMRILYVAMTRAIDKLIMVGTIKNLDKISEKWILGTGKYFRSKANSYLDWVGACNFQGCEPYEIKDMFKENKVGDLKIALYNYEDIVGLKSDINNEEEMINRINQLDSYIKYENKELVENRLSFKYPYDLSVNTPTKLSVTSSQKLDKEKFESMKYNINSLANLMDYDEINKSFIKKEVEYNGASIGTLVHLVMEHIDLTQTLDRENLIEQIKNIESRKLLKPRDANFILNRYLDKLFRFFHSDIGIRIRKSNFVKRESTFIIKKKANELLDILREDDDILIEGVIDCYFYEDDHIILLDYKTDAVKEGNIDILKEEYKYQINSYKKALEDLTKKKVKASYLYLFSIDSVVEVI